MCELWSMLSKSVWDELWKEKLTIVLWIVSHSWHMDFNNCLIINFNIICNISKKKTIFFLCLPFLTVGKLCWYGWTTFFMAIYSIVSPTRWPVLAVSMSRFNLHALNFCTSNGHKIMHFFKYAIIVVFLRISASIYSVPLKSSYIN